ncbi:MAG: hypothetical protein JNK02_07270 [Planctomycetes bacterium]|nr:hypothetical protein [Planctomycetota bacterium]
MSSPRAACPPAALLWLLALVGAAQRASAQADPFAPGVRWTQAPAPGAPALPRAAALAADDNAGLGAWSGAHPGFSAGSAHALGSADPFAREAAAPGATGSSGIAAGAGPWIYMLSQVPAPDAWSRRTRVEGATVDAAASAGALVPAWVRETAFAANGPARIAVEASGASAWFAAFDDGARRVRVERLAGADGAVLAARDLDAVGLQELAVAADGSRVALAAGLDLFVLDGQGATVHQAALTATTTALSLSGDGHVLVHGVTGGLARRVQVGASYTVAPGVAAGPGELAVRAALDAAGATLAIGWWHAPTGVAWRFEVHDLVLATRVVERVFGGAPGGLQDLPTAVALTPDGRRAAFTCWSGATGAPELAIWDRASDAWVVEADLPGSAFALALDATGTRALVAAKSAHANVLSATGELVLVDTGERDLQVLGPAQTGGVLHLAARQSGATAVLFLFGDPAPAPFRVPGVAGRLHLQRAGLGVQRVLAGPDGRADLVLPLPLDPAAIGSVRHAQAAFRGPGGTTLGATLVRVRIL